MYTTLFAIHANHLKLVNIIKRNRTNNVLLWSPLIQAILSSFVLSYVNKVFLLFVSRVSHVFC